MIYNVNENKDEYKEDLRSYTERKFRSFFLTFKKTKKNEKLLAKFLRTKIAKNFRVEIGWDGDATVVLINVGIGEFQKWIPWIPSTIIPLLGIKGTSYFPVCSTKRLYFITMKNNLLKYYSETKAKEQHFLTQILNCRIAGNII